MSWKSNSLEKLIGWGAVHGIEAGLGGVGGLETGFGLEGGGFSDPGGASVGHGEGVGNEGESRSSLSTISFDPAQFDLAQPSRTSAFNDAFSSINLGVDPTSDIDSSFGSGFGSGFDFDTNAFSDIIDNPFENPFSDQSLLSLGWAPSQQLGGSFRTDTTMTVEEQVAQTDALDTVYGSATNQDVLSDVSKFDQLGAVMYANPGITSAIGAVVTAFNPLAGMAYNVLTTNITKGREAAQVEAFTGLASLGLSQLAAPAVTSLSQKAGKFGFEKAGMTGAMIGVAGVRKAADFAIETGSREIGQAVAASDNEYTGDALFGQEDLERSLLGSEDASAKMGGRSIDRRPQRVEDFNRFVRLTSMRDPYRYYKSILADIEAITKE